jgi:hypothetical protein
MAASGTSFPVSLWRYRCLECKNEIEEWRPESNRGAAKHLICPSCTRLAVNRFLRLGDSEMPTYCEPCAERGKPNVTAHRFVNGRPMCNDCWGGGMGPGVQKDAGAIHTPAASRLMDPTLSHTQRMAQDPAKPALCRCGRPVRHIGRCWARCGKSGPPSNRPMPHALPPAIPATAMKTGPPSPVSTNISGAALRSQAPDGSTLELLRKVITDLKRRRAKIEEAIEGMEEWHRKLQNREL